MLSSGELADQSLRPGNQHGTLVSEKFHKLPYMLGAWFEIAEYPCFIYVLRGLRMDYRICHGL